MLAGHAWGVACGHIEDFWLFLFPLQKKNRYERLAGLTSLKYAVQNSYTTTNQDGVVQKSHWCQLTMAGPD